ATIRELSDTHGRTESYADTLRQQLEERMETADNAIRSRSELQETLDFTITNLRELQARNDTLSVEHADMAQRLEQTEKAHEEEIRVIRFELGEAQDTATQKEQLNEQLVSDLIDTRNSRLQLESELAEAGAEIRGQVKALEADNSRLRVEISELTEQLESKAETINGLLAELATKTEQIQSIGEIEHVIQEIDERMSDQVHGQARTDRERVMRVLVGSIDGQELRFPLFKPKLTIGRTEQNDIQLRAPYISRRHAVIVTEGDITRVIDWGSKNGVYVNADRISERFLQSGDIVGIGKARFRYEERPMRDA
ncbi:MAG: FHA domain-containing protein, partial [Gammaproteobacteria bacterium]|nr:FHA domain-containing protein [Gammaproteobacteria bacterium]